MISKDLEEALKTRERKRIDDSEVDIRVYDTDQIIIFGNNVIDSPTRIKGSKQITEADIVPAQIVLNLRTGESSASLNPAGTEYEGTPCVRDLRELVFYEHALELLKVNNIDIDKWKVKNDYLGTSPKRFPELEIITDFLDANFADDVWLTDNDGRSGFFSTLMGNGYVRRRDLLNPLELIGCIIETIFPFNHLHFFDFKKGRENLKRKGHRLLDPTEVEAYNDPVILITPFDLRRECYQENTADIYIFNPKNYQDYLGGKFKPKTLIPSARDWNFRICYGLGSGRKWMRFSADRFDRSGVSRRGLLDHKRYDLFLKADPSIIRTFERIAPLDFYL